MKKIFAIAFFISAMCVFAFGQKLLPEIEIAREIKLLRSTHKNVLKIMGEFDRDEDDGEEEDDEVNNEIFRSDRATVKVSFSTGGCSEDFDAFDLPVWNISKQIATKVVVEFHETTTLKDLGMNLSGFKKRLEDEDYEDSEEFIYYDDNAGIMILTDEDEVEKIILHPPKKDIGYLCVNEGNEELLSGEKSFIDVVKDSAYVCRLLNYPTDVTNLDLKPNGVFGCKNENCTDAKKEISVSTTAVDKENEVLTYEYFVSGGEIVGSGANVVWDLRNVKPGTYSITASASDGCGICGETKTQYVLVGENSFETIPPAKIKQMTLDKTELVASCPVGRLRKVRCPSGNCGIAVRTVAVSNDKGANFTYKYEVTGGKIFGEGANIVWDLSELTLGTYTIKVKASDDGVLFSDPTETTIEIIENPICSANKK